MFETLHPSKPDQIMALNAAFRADPREAKLDLGVGVYKDEAGRTPILRAVKAAERRLVETQATKAYLSPAGDPAFCAAMVALAFGADAPNDRIAAVQTVGGTGAVRILCDLVARAERGATVWLPDPTWPNHPAIAKQAGLGFRTYTYFDPATVGVAWEAMRAALSEAGPGDVVLLHGCCHNPTGADLTPEQWREIAALAVDRGFTPFLDLAYQGFGDGLEPDATGLRILAAAVPEMLVALSCSKNFALYRDRVGCAAVLAAAPAAADLAGDNLRALARVTYSMPADHGAAVVSTILGDAALREDWTAELDAMRARILTLRTDLAAALRERLNDDGFDFISRHRGMFSLTGLSAEIVERMRAEHGVYLVGDGRMNVAGLNAAGVRRFADALAAVRG
ncbi:aromatic amino acid transaminase [Rubrimonas cliftonensis]|uniref:Aminotransferase n=1 Tax=Rubrimonas cliftonensis TaxID=89524 RepID=A0A1H3W7S2_9RHOB|nr:amino acid aminotransferase [Rubrimonas cliftonensis]SDZ82392.1 aromatic amino acid aminotransferase apoenzyme [Rubrimonas cliftonensis]